MKYFGIASTSGTMSFKRRAMLKNAKVQEAVRKLQKLGVQGSYVYGKIVYDYPGSMGKGTRVYTFPYGLGELNRYVSELQKSKKIMEKFSMMDIVEENDMVKYALVALLVVVILYLLSQNKDVKKMMKKLLK